MSEGRTIPIHQDVDVVTARQVGRELATAIGFSRGEQALVATSISELARNILQYAGSGAVRITLLQDGARRGLEIIAEDQGPGIPDVSRALEDGYSTSQGLGLGLPGVRRLMDELEIVSEVGGGTRVLARKWVG